MVWSGREPPRIEAVTLSATPSLPIGLRPSLQPADSTIPPLSFLCVSVPLVLLFIFFFSGLNGMGWEL